MKNREWKEWAVDYIKSTKRCPGEYPAFGLVTDLVTEDQFLQSIESSGTHLYIDCHFVDEVMGVVSKDLKIVESPNPKITKDDLEKLKNELSEDEQTIKRLKKDLKTYVDLIVLKQPGVLYIPEPLLKLETFVKKFFNIKG